MKTARQRCPACQEEVTFIPAGEGETCPKCVAHGDGDAGGQVAAEGESPAHTLLTWLVLGAFLLAPPVITFLAATHWSANATLRTALYGSGLAAVFGALWLAVRLNLRRSARIGMALLLAPAFFGVYLLVALVLGVACLVVCLALVFVGCAALIGAK